MLDSTPGERVSSGARPRFSHSLTRAPCSSARAGGEARLVIRSRTAFPQATRSLTAQTQLASVAAVPPGAPKGATVSLKPALS